MLFIQSLKKTKTLRVSGEKDDRYLLMIYAAEKTCRSLYNVFFYDMALLENYQLHFNC